ncbi:LAFA_0A07360g1_1 [Lachancea sp. 'fantastica']|nr:LAFA_0A07360g1_1 [Lachancea sp. 'fantastica']
MLFIQIVLSALLSIHCAAGLTVKQPHVAFASSRRNPLAMSPLSSNYEKPAQPLKIDRANETLEVNFSIDTEDAPEQAVLLFGSISKGVEVSYEPIIKNVQSATSTYKFKIPIEKLPEPLLYLSIVSKEALSATLVLANPNGESSDNMLVELFDVDLVFELEKKPSWPARMGPKPQITHIFKGTAKTAPAWVTRSTSVIVAACFAAVIVAWQMLGIFTAVRLPLTNSRTIYVLAFVGSVIGMEYVFVQYYLGASIFVTLEHAFYASIGSLFAGAKLLQS